MKLEQQVVSLELAKRLKALGVKQEALFYWNAYQDYTDREGGGYQRVENTWKVVRFGEVSGTGENYAAFTVAELGEMLPEITRSGRESDGEWHCRWENKRSSDTWHERRADTEAEARGLVLAYLIENKLLTI